MYALMSYKSDVLTECLITHIASKRALTSMCALMCYKMDLLTEWLTTHITSKRALTTTNITGISAFSTVYMKLFIWSALVKTQRLNIRLHSDRKNNYLYRYIHTHTYIYTGCPTRSVPDFGRVFLMLKYTDITQNTYIQSWTVTEIKAREKCGLLAVQNS